MDSFSNEAHTNLSDIGLFEVPITSGNGSIETVMGEKGVSTPVNRGGRVEPTLSNESMLQAMHIDVVGDLKDTPNDMQRKDRLFHPPQSRRNTSYNQQGCKNMGLRAGIDKISWWLSSQKGRING
ncbi:hypothetical protein V6N13_142248 [Hibiscus sabdariffa]